MNRPIHRTLLPALFLSMMGLSTAALAQHHDMAGKMDGDGDGRVSAAEHAAAAQAMFDKADADHDGSLSAGEMQAMHAGMASHDMAGGKKMACCCAGDDGKMACGDMKKDDPIKRAMSGHENHG